MRSLIAPALLVTLIACSTTSTHSIAVREDEPDAAAEYYAAKRAGTDDPHARYALAREEMRRMPHRFFREGADATDTREIDRWLPLGPGNIGGRTRTLVIDPAQP